MMKLIHNIFKPLLVFAVLSCTPEWDVDTSFSPEIVVEGWIENGEPAQVLISQMIKCNVTDDAEFMQISDLPIRWATVSISDGEQEEMLVGQVNRDYIPPYIYAGSRIKGEPGKEYTLTIKYSGRTVTATTTVPENVPIDRVEVSASPDTDTLHCIDIYFKDKPDEVNFYKVFTKVKNTDTRYFAAFMGDFTDEVLGEESRITVNRAFRHTRYYEHTPYFYDDDTVYVKLAHLPEEGFEFWNSYENEVTNGTNILFPSTSNLKSNIVGGRGIWCGYGIDIAEIIIKEDD